MRSKYCPSCGSLLELKNIGDDLNVPYCTNCKIPYFDHPTPCVFLIVENKEHKFLTIKQSYGSDMYVLVAGFLKLNETVEECARRELKEETGLDAYNIKYIKSYYQDTKENLMIGLHVDVNDCNIKLSSEVKSAHFVSKEEVIKDLNKATRALDLFKTYINNLEEKENESL